MTDLDSEIVALLVAGAGEREICIRLGCTPGKLRSAHATRRGADVRSCAGGADALATFDALEQAWALRAKSGDKASKALLARIRR